MIRTLSTDETRAFYDRLGVLLDTQRLYEDPARAALAERARFAEARAVFELGCGTGAFARMLLTRVLPSDCRYVGVDLSPKMIRLARARLGRWLPRAEVRLVEGSMPMPWPDGAFDRFVATYVLDLMSPEEIQAALGEARRLLSAEGLLCVVSLTHGERALARLVSATWSRIHALSPKILGGCRPIRLVEHLAEARWRVEHRGVVTAWGVASEVLVAARIS